MATKTEPKQTARQVEAERKKAESQLATVRAQLETIDLQERYRLLTEAPQPVQVPWYDFPAYDEFSQWPSGFSHAYWQSSAEDRVEGRYRPVYETEQDLRRLRAQARKFKAFFPVAESALDSLTNYVMSGCEITVQPKKGHPLGAKLAPIVQKVVDKFLECNDFIGDMDRQIHIESRVDGEVFATLYPVHNQVRIELTDPDFICTPLNPRPLEQWLGQGHKLNAWWHGVHTQWNRQLMQDDTRYPLGYHAVKDRTGEMWQYLKAEQVEHIKRNVNHMSRRGVSDFNIICQELQYEAKLRRNTAVGAAILAAIVMIREHAEGVSKTSIESMVSASSTRNYEKPIQDGTRTTYREDIQPGTVKDTPYGMKTTPGPMGTLNQPVYIEVNQFLLRVIGNRWRFPEFLISSDASNANYASSLVSESPFVKYCENEQEFYSAKFEDLIWKALKLYYEMGRLPDTSWHTFEAAIEIDVNYASPASRDGLQQAQENQILCDAGLLSKRTWATNAGLDFDEEQKNIQQDGGCGGACACGAGGGMGAGGNAAASNALRGSGFYSGGVNSAASSSGAAAGDSQSTETVVDAVNEDGEVIGQAVIPTSTSGGPGAAAPVVVVQARSSPAARPSFAAPRPSFRPAGRPQTDPGRRSEFESEHRTETLALRAMDLLMERNLRERTSDEEGRWITMNGQAVKISDDGTMLTGPMKGQKLGSGDTDGASDDDTPPMEYQGGPGEGARLRVPIEELEYVKSAWPEDATPLEDNRDMPIIVQETPTGWKIIDGYGRSAGMKNAGNEWINAIVVTPGDIAERGEGVQGDDPAWVRDMHKRYAPKSRMADMYAAAESVRRSRRGRVHEGSDDANT